jgi:hypothetical protein
VKTAETQTQPVLFVAWYQVNIHPEKIMGIRSLGALLKMSSHDFHVFGTYIVTVMRLASSVIMIFFDAFAIITASIYPITPF